MHLEHFPPLARRARRRSPDLAGSVDRRSPQRTASPRRRPLDGSGRPAVGIQCGVGDPRTTWETRAQRGRPAHNVGAALQNVREPFRHGGNNSCLDPSHARPSSSSTCSRDDIRSARATWISRSPPLRCNRSKCCWPSSLAPKPPPFCRCMAIARSPFFLDTRES
jgi:hypothetical protein